MSEPTKEQIEEARTLRKQFIEYGDVVINSRELAKLIAAVRTQATNDALERAACFFVNAPHASTTTTAVAGALRALKVPQ